MTYKLLFLDTETTGNRPQDRITQVAYEIGETRVCKLFKPPLPISVESMEVTHITNAMVEDKEPFHGSDTYIGLEQLLGDPTVVLVAHNASFDVEMLEREGLTVIRVIDTLKLARHLDTNAKLDAYRLQYLRYLMNLDEYIDEPIQAHDALGDVIVLRVLFERLKTGMEKIFSGTPDELIEEMIRISEQPTLIKKFTFGKYRGTLIEEVAKTDRGYLEWLLGQKRDSDQDETDWIYTLETFLK